MWNGLLFENDLYLSAKKIVELYINLGLKLATAESCTGGLLGELITAIPNSSQMYYGGIVSYNNHAKKQWLGVNQETLYKYGAVSEQVAQQMVKGLFLQDNLENRIDIGIGITGIAGPKGGTIQKPVGLVYIACYYSVGNQWLCRKLQLGSHQERQQIRANAITNAFQMLQEIINM